SKKDRIEQFSFISVFTRRTTPAPSTVRFSRKCNRRTLYIADGRYFAPMPPQIWFCCSKVGLTSSMISFSISSGSDGALSFSKTALYWKKPIPYDRSEERRVGKECRTQT